MRWSFVLLGIVLGISGVYLVHRSQIPPTPAPAPAPAPAAAPSHPWCLACTAAERAGLRLQALPEFRSIG